LGLEEGLERACRIPLDQINERFAGVAGLNLDFNPIIIDNRGRSIKLTFTLQRKDGFCETAINKAFLILSRLGVGEEIALEVIQDLQLTQIQQVKFQGVWLSYYQYLMLTHPLMRNRKTS